MAINYNKTEWKAGKEGGTAWTPDRLNNIENGIEQTTNAVNQLNNDVVSINSNLSSLQSEVTKKRKTILQTNVDNGGRVTANFPDYLTNYLVLVNTYGNGNAQNNVQLYMVSTGTSSGKTSTVTTIFATTKSLTFNWNNTLSLEIQANSGTWNIVTIY